MLAQRETRRENRSCYLAGAKLGAPRRRRRRRRRDLARRIGIEIDAATRDFQRGRRRGRDGKRVRENEPQAAQSAAEPPVGGKYERVGRDVVRTLRRRAAVLLVISRVIARVISMILRRGISVAAIIPAARDTSVRQRTFIAAPARSAAPYIRSNGDNGRRLHAMLVRPGQLLLVSKAAAFLPAGSGVEASAGAVLARERNRAILFYFSPDGSAEEGDAERAQNDDRDECSHRATDRFRDQRFSSQRQTQDGLSSGPGSLLTSAMLVAGAAPHKGRELPLDRFHSSTSSTISCSLSIAGASIVCFTPLGQRISALAIFCASPKPKGIVFDDWER
jgi:hypothetical protein